MRFFVATVAAGLLTSYAFADGNDFQQTTDKALAAGSPQAVVKALDRESYRGNLVASLQLGLIYRDGKGVPRDLAKAREYLKEAASTNLVRIWYRHGLAEAQYELGLMLQTGMGGKPDPSDAESWYTEAAQQGEPRAQLALAKMYLDGTGVKRDVERAFFWSSLAEKSMSDAALKEAEQVRARSQNELDPGMLPRARNMIEAWKPRAS